MDPDRGRESEKMRSVAPEEVIFVVEEAEEGGYHAHALGADIFTQADDLEELREMIREAVHVHFDDEHRPGIIHLHFVRDEVIDA